MRKKQKRNVNKSNWNIYDLFPSFSHLNDFNDFNYKMGPLNLSFPTHIWRRGGIWRRKVKRKSIIYIYTNIFLMESSMMNKQFEKILLSFFLLFDSFMGGSVIIYRFWSIMRYKKTRNEKFVVSFNAKPLII